MAGWEGKCGKKETGGVLTRNGNLEAHVTNRNPVTDAPNKTATVVGERGSDGEDWIREVSGDEETRPNRRVGEMESRQGVGDIFEPPSTVGASKQEIN